MTVYTKLFGHGDATVRWNGNIDNVAPGDVVFPYPQVMKTMGENSYASAKKDASYLVISVSKQQYEETTYGALTMRIMMTIMGCDGSLWQIKHHVDAERA